MPLELLAVRPARGRKYGENALLRQAMKLTTGYLPALGTLAVDAKTGAACERLFPKHLAIEGFPLDDRRRKLARHRVIAIANALHTFAVGERRAGIGEDLAERVRQEPVVAGVRIEERERKLHRRLVRLG